MADAIEAVLGKHRSGADRRHRALAIIAAEIGAIAVARATAKSHPRLSKEVLIGVRRVLGEVGRQASVRRGQAPPRSRDHRRGDRRHRRRASYCQVAPAVVEGGSDRRSPCPRGSRGRGPKVAEENADQPEDEAGESGRAITVR